jgi:saccharopine dehydrogenase-like NADP-dependent oxidoreductase
MEILLLGVGMQGKAALLDLVGSSEVSSVIAADANINMLRSTVDRYGWGGKVRCEPLDAADSDSIDRLMSLRPDVVIDLLPPRFIPDVARSAVEHHVHLVNTFYAPDEMRALDEEARARNVTLLPEFGLDPGIDLVMLGEAARTLDTIEEMHSYGAGIPELEAADNPLRYKVSWSFEGVLAAYRRPARVIQGGAIVEIEPTEVFSKRNVHEVDVLNVGVLEAYPNGDAVKYADLLGLDADAVEEAGRYTMRWPGHSTLWKNLVDLHLLDADPVLVDGRPVDRVRFLAAAIGPHIQYGPKERDLVVLRVDVTGHDSGRRRSLRFELVDRLDLDSGLSAMSRTVGFTASIGAIMIGDGRIERRGVLTPVKDVQYGALTDELAKRGIGISCDELAM